MLLTCHRWSHVTVTETIAGRIGLYTARGSFQVNAKDELHT